MKSKGKFYPASSARWPKSRWANSGVLDIMTWNGTLPAGLVNSGLILDRSAIKVQSCAVQGVAL